MMITNPIFSVIVPNYNHSQYLDKRINSILNQTFKDFEIIILDDCSIDNSTAIIEKYKDNEKVSKVIYNVENSGSTFLQWEKGIELALGKYIWIAESDDWCEPTLLHHLLKGFISNEACTISYCQSYSVNNSGYILWQSAENHLSKFYDGKSFIKSHMVYKNSIFNTSMALWKKSAYQKISKDYTLYKFCGDWLFWIELCLTGEIHVSGRLLNYFRNHSEDVSSNALKTGLNFQEDIQVIKKIFYYNLIGEREYIKVLKRKYREYWLTKKNMQINDSERIRKLFYDALPYKTAIAEMAVDAIWKKLRTELKINK